MAALFADKETIQELCDEWQPEPLLSVSSKEPEADFPAPLAIGKYRAPFLTLESDPDREIVNFGSFHFLGLGDHPRVIEAAKEGVRKYGVGSCGPRGFYGTFDVHLQLEADLAKFYGVEECIVFSSNYATVSSTIPAFAKRGDYVICDKGISHALQTGVLLSRSNAYWFKHNDPEDLERVMLEIQRLLLLKKVDLDKPTMRIFVIFEGLSPNYGDIAPVKKYLELKRRFNFRIIMDDSAGLGTLGRTGRGTLEHLGIPVSDVEIITASLSHSLGSVGGFCIGSKEVVYHQRLNAAGYVFSASSPPYLLVAASKALTMIDQNLVGKLQENVALAHSLLKDLGVLTAHGSAQSAVIHLRLTRSTGSRTDDNWLLQRISDECLKQGFAVPRARYVEGEKYQPPPSLRLCISAVHEKQHLERIMSVLDRVSRKFVEDQLLPPQ